jgi:DNA-binding GntR family transcriptional regulator
MSRIKTANLPDLQALLAPQHPLMLAVEQAMLRGPEWVRAAPSVADRIAVRIAGVITLGQVQPGQRLLEQDIGAVLRVSRAPVREALRILEREHLVELQPRRGAIVTAPDAAELSDIFTVRGALYAILLQQLMQERPADLERVLSEHIERVAKAARESAEAFAVASFLLNLAIADLGGKRLLANLLKSVALRTLRYVRLGRSANPRSVPASLRSWRALRQAVAERDTGAVLSIAAARIEEIRRTSLLALPASAGHRASAVA